MRRKTCLQISTLLVLANTALTVFASDGPVEPLRTFQQEGGPQDCSDVLTLTDGSLRIGRVMEWADQVLVFRPGGTFESIPNKNVESFEFRREAGSNQKKLRPDLTIAFIERDLKSGADSKRSFWTEKYSAGDSVKLRVHLINAGGAASQPVSASLFADNREIASDVSIPALQPGARHSFETDWSVGDGEQFLKVVVNDVSSQSDATRWNNIFVEPVNAIGVTVRVDEALFNSGTFGLVGTDAFADFAQYHIQCFNALLANSKSEVAPDGISLRFRCNRIEVVKDLPSTGKDSSDRSPVISFRGPLKSDVDPMADTLRVDWQALQQFCYQIGLTDPSTLNTEISQVHVYNRFDRPALVSYKIPKDLVSLTSVAGGHLFSDIEAAYLNSVQETPPAATGSYWLQIPKSISLRVFGNDGRPLKGARVDMFQLQNGGTREAAIVGAGQFDPIVATETDDLGIAMIPNRAASIFGELQPDLSNGLLVFRIRQETSNGMPHETYRFLSAADCVRQSLRGQKDEFIVDVNTGIAPEGTIQSPPFVVPLSADENPDGGFAVAWPMPTGLRPTDVREFRVYSNTGYGSATGEWTLRGVVRRVGENIKTSIELSELGLLDEKKKVGEDTHVAVSAVGLDGVEGALSEPGLLSSAKKAPKLAIWDSVAYMSLESNGSVRMLYWDGVAGTQAYMPRTDAKPGYVPHFSGLAFLDGRLVATDPVNHILAFYNVDKGEHQLVKTIPDRNEWPADPGFLAGTFFRPMDVAVDDSGTIYVADTGNHRVQMLDREGVPLGILDADFRFQSPSAIAYSYGQLCVTDKNGSRIRVYSIKNGKAEFKTELPALLDADRAVADIAGRIFALGRISASERRSVLCFDISGDSPKFVQAIDEGSMGRYEDPRGIYPHGKEKFQAYFVNSFPFGVRRIQIGPDPKQR